MDLNQIIKVCGDPCKLFLDNYITFFSASGLIIVVLIFIRLRQISKFVGELKQETEALRTIAKFPYCEECPYKEICPKRTEEFKECTYEFRKSLVDDRR